MSGAFGNWNAGKLFMPGWKAAPSVAATVVDKMPSSASFTSGSPVTLPWLPTNGSWLILNCWSNQFDVTSVVQTGVTWTKLVGGGIYSGAFAAGSIWLGTVGAGASSSLTITQSGNNSQQYYVYSMVGISTKTDKSQVVGASTASTTASIQPTYLYAQTFFLYMTRGTFVSGPTESGWHLIKDNVSDGSVGYYSCGWRTTDAATLSASFTGATNNNVDMIANLTP